MKKFKLIVLFASVFITTSVHADEQAVINSYEFELDKSSVSNPQLGTYGMSFYSVNGKTYEFFDENNQYNVIYELADDTTKMGWLVVDSTLTNKVKEIYIDRKLTMFGNAIYYNGHLYVVYGQNDTVTTDTTSSDFGTTTTLEVVKYDTNGNIVKNLEIAGKETSSINATSVTSDKLGYGTAKPFDSGNCDLAVNSKGIIKIVFNREMYNGHTSNFGIYIDSSDLTYLNRPTTLSNTNKYFNLNTGYYASHSFEERVIADSNDEFVSVDLGDAYPRAFYLAKPYDVDGSVMQKISEYNVFHFREGNDTSYGYNSTFASLGNIVEVSDGYILVAASEKTLSINYAPYRNINESRNIFIQKYSLDLKDKTAQTIQMLNTSIRQSETSRTSAANLGKFFLSSSGVTDYGVKWLTDYDSTKTITEVRAVKINNNNTLIVWSECELVESTSGFSTKSSTKKYYYLIIDKDGTIVQDTTIINTATPTMLIDYVYKDGYVYWTDTSNKSSVTINQLNVSETEEAAYINRVGEEDVKITDASFTTKQFSATTNKDVNIIWKSSNTNVATIDENGLATIVGNGTATITASLEGYTISTTWNLDVSYMIEDVTANSEEITLESGISKTIYVTITPSNAKTKKLDWKSSNEEVFTIDTIYSNGPVKINTVGLGEATLTGTTTDGSNITVSIKIKVVNPITSITFNESSPTIAKGESRQLDFSVNPTDATEKVKWVSSNEDIVKVDENGVITGVSGGGTYVVASSDYNGIHKMIYVNVLVPMTGISFDKTSIQLKPGDTVDLNTIVTPNDTTDSYTMTISNNNSSVVSYSKGVVTALKEGTATITVTTSNGFSATCEITVSDYIKGDMDKNGSLSFSDVMILLRTYLNVTDTSSDSVQIGDMNENGKLDFSDVMMLLRTYLNVS